MELVANYPAVSFAPVQEAMGALLSTAKEWTLWMGHKVYVFAAFAWDATKAGLIKLLELSADAWKACLPYIVRGAAFLVSPPGIFAVGLLASALILRMAVNDDNLADATGRRMMVVLGAVVLSATMVFATQVGFWFIPQLVPREALRQLAIAYA